MGLRARILPVLVTNYCMSMHRTWSRSNSTVRHWGSNKLVNQCLSIARLGLKIVKAPRNVVIQQSSVVFTVLVNGSWCCAIQGGLSLPNLQWFLLQLSATCLVIALQFKTSSNWQHTFNSIGSTISGIGPGNTIIPATATIRQNHSLSPFDIGCEGRFSSGSEKVRMDGWIRGVSHPFGTG